MGGKKNKGGKGQGRPQQRVPTSGDSNSGKHMTQQNKVEGGNPKKDSDTHTNAAQEETLQPHDPVAPDTDNWEKYAEGATIQMDSSQTIPETNFDDEIEPQAIYHQYQKDNKRSKKGNKSQVPDGAPFNMTEVDGDLFDAPPEFSFAHCVARDMAMGAGIALRFRELFRGTGSLVDQHVKVGGVAHLEKNGRFVYYLVTKTHSSHKPTMKSMESSLLELKKLMTSHNVKKLAIPEIGCGLDRLDWDDVKRLIKNIFSDTDVHIQVYHYKKHLERMWNNSHYQGNCPKYYHDTETHYSSYKRNYKSRFFCPTGHNDRNKKSKITHYFTQKQQLRYNHINALRSDVAPDNGNANELFDGIHGREILQDRHLNINQEFLDIETSTSRVQGNISQFDVDRPDDHYSICKLPTVNCTFTCIKGDLFNAPPEYSLAHCVGSDFRMGAGIAIQFRRRFGNVSVLLDQRVDVGGVAFLRTEDKFIYYLVTKRYSNGKPALHALYQALLSLRDKMSEHGVKRLAIPTIGCGLDNLKWEYVKGMILDVFHEVEIDINVYFVNQNIDDAAGGASKQDKKPFTPRIKNAEKLLEDMEYGTARIFLCCENDECTPDMLEFNIKHMFLNKYKSAKKVMGDAVRIPIHNYDIVYGLVCRKSLKHPISFVTLENCMEKFNAYNKKDFYKFLGIQAFEEKDNDVVVDQVINIIKNCTKYPCSELWVCWPQNLKHKCFEFNASSGTQSSSRSGK